MQPEELFIQSHLTVPLGRYANEKNNTIVNDAGGITQNVVTTHTVLQRSRSW